MNLKEGLKKGIDIYVNEYFKLELGMNIKDYTYELDFEKNWVEFHMPDEPHNSSWLWSSYFSDINEIKDFLNKSVTDSYRFGDFVKESLFRS